MTTKSLFAGALMALLTLPAAAQNTPEGTPTRIRGTVEKLDVQTASRRPANRTKRYWAVGGTRRAKRSQVRLGEA